MEQPLIVQAEYSFKGGNNDELCFKKGDLITVTQREEGGWWEGTLNDKTGWFPSNYVIEYKAPLPLSEAIRPPEEIQEYRSVVLKDLLDSERAHVAEIQGLLENFLEPLQQTQILTVDEYAQLMCNFVEVVKMHEELFSNMEECHDRVGKLFLTKAPLMKQVHQAYCAAHPKAIVILDKYKDELENYMEQQGAATPGLLVLTTGLSKPFRRLDKYSAMLQELERHMESSHPDRGDTQRSVSVYKDIAATCSATRRQKELELQVLTGPVRGWQGQELSSLGDIIHMGSVAVGPDHRDRYFVLFPQTLLILSVSQRMSAFIYEGKLPLINISINRLEDCDTYKNAFEITGPLIERIIAVCQGPNEANKWVHLLSSANPTMPIGIKRQLSNLSNSSSGGIHAPAPPAHMSPPASLGMPSHHHPPSVPSRPMATSVISNSHQSQHKRSLSFNHHLSYNQFTHTQHPPHLHHQQPPQSLPNHPVGVAAVPNHKSSLVPTLNSISKTTQMGIANTVGNARTGNIKANWSITNLRPAPPLRPNLLNPTSSGSSNTLSSYCSFRKTQPTFEEDALVLRVFEAYCAAYQNNARNTIHSALQPWTPCLLIRGGKLKTSKPFSTSNPQLPFVCSQAQQPFALGSSAPSHFPPSSTNSLNSSFIWREASPNSFNLYSTSVSSLNNGGYRYSLGGAGATNSQFSPIPSDHRALSEERATRKSLNRMKSGFGSGYDNIFMTPLLPRKSKQLLKNVYQSHQRTPPPPSATISKSVTPSYKQPLLTRNHSEEQPSSTERYPPSPGLYDRRLNRSFETASRGYGHLYALKRNASLQRSTPQLVADIDANDLDVAEQHSSFRECGRELLKNGRSNAFECTASTGSTASDVDSQRHSATWCCGLENEDMTPTLRQLWTAMRQMQQDMSQIKLQINEERSLRVNLQQVLMQHLETASSTATTSAAPKC